MRKKKTVKWEDSRFTSLLQQWKMPLMSIDWDKAFSEAEKSLCIQNVNPCSSNKGSRNIFKEDKKQILQAAEKHGFRLIGEDKWPIVSFIRKRP